MTISTPHTTKGLWTVSRADVGSPRRRRCCASTTSTSPTGTTASTSAARAPGGDRDRTGRLPSDDLAGPTGVFLLGRYDGEPQSCAGLRVLDDRSVELTRVFVRHAVRGTGGGARLLAAVDEAARELGAERIVLDTRLDLVEARALYTRHGYREIPAYSSSPYAQIWYGRDLTAPAA
ncbi:GNAT family N-acetyltransferase [Kitasatospora aburaviensis]